jgi:hypothetical protein
MYHLLAALVLATSRKEGDNGQEEAHEGRGCLKGVSWKGGGQQRLETESQAGLSGEIGKGDDVKRLTSSLHKPTQLASGSQPHKSSGGFGYLYQPIPPAWKHCVGEVRRKEANIQG